MIIIIINIFKLIFMPAFANTFVFKNLEQQVRLGAKPDHPHLIGLYIGLGDEHAKSMPAEKQRHLYRHIFQVLVDTFCDSALAYHWRCLCLDNAHVPLSRLNQLAYSKEDEQRIDKLFQELSTLSHYFFGSPATGDNSDYLSNNELSTNKHFSFMHNPEK